MRTPVTFENSSVFRNELRKRVDAYFADTKLTKRDNLRLFIKSAIMILWMAASYYVLVFQANHVAVMILATISLALSLVGIGFNIQHDGNHLSFSRKPWLNRIAGSTLDYFLGASSFMWKQKHNIRHHPYTNIPKNDDDINLSFMGRLASTHKYYSFHRYQQFYLWFIYSFLHVRYLFSDFQKLIVGNVQNKKIERPKGWELVTFIVGKVVFFGLAFAVPTILHPVWLVIICYLATSIIIGLIFSIVFQLAHMVKETEHPSMTESIPSEWAIHQLKTTANFAPRNRLLTWYLGGLNHQIEHHLFTDIAHVHYSKLAVVIQQTCAEYGIEYNVHNTLWSAVRSHYRYLRHMGKPTSV